MHTGSAIVSSAFTVVNLRSSKFLIVCSGTVPRAQKTKGTISILVFQSVCSSTAKSKYFSTFPCDSLQHDGPSRKQYQ